MFADIDLCYIIWSMDMGHLSCYEISCAMFVLQVSEKTVTKEKSVKPKSTRSKAEKDAAEVSPQLTVSELRDVFVAYSYKKVY